MKVLVAADVHGSLLHAEYLINRAEENGADAIFQCGDFGAWEHYPRGRQFFDGVAEAAQRASIPFYWLDGNHDKTSLVLSKYGENRTHDGFVICRDGLYYAPRGHRWEWEGRKFMSLGGAYSVDKDYRLGIERASNESETLWFPEEEPTDAEVQSYIDADPTPLDVLFTHDKPRASNPGWNRKDFPECYANQDRVQNVVESLIPRLLIHGHLHYRYTDVIQTSNGKHTTVDGLQCDPAAGAHIPGYRREDSWVILNVENPELSSEE